MLVGQPMTKNWLAYNQYKFSSRHYISISQKNNQYLTLMSRSQETALRKFLCSFLLIHRQFLLPLCWSFEIIRVSGTYWWKLYWKGREQFGFRAYCLNPFTLTFWIIYHIKLQGFGIQYVHIQREFYLCGHVQSYTYSISTSTEMDIAIQSHSPQNSEVKKIDGCRPTTFLEIGCKVTFLRTMPQGHLSCAGAAKGLTKTPIHHGNMVPRGSRGSHIGDHPINRTPPY